MAVVRPLTGAACLSAARMRNSPLAQQLSMRWMSSPAAGAFLHACRIIEVCIVWSGMRVDSMSLVVFKTTTPTTMLSLLSVYTTRPQGRGTLYLICQFAVVMRRRLLLGTSCSLRVVRGQLERCRFLTSPLDSGDWARGCLKAEYATPVLSRKASYLSPAKEAC